MRKVAAMTLAFLRELDVIDVSPPFLCTEVSAAGTGVNGHDGEKNGPDGNSGPAAHETADGSWAAF